MTEPRRRRDTVYALVHRIDDSRGIAYGMCERERSARWGFYSQDEPPASVVTCLGCWAARP